MLKCLRACFAKLRTLVVYDYHTVYSDVNVFCLHFSKKKRVKKHDLKKFVLRKFYCTVSGNTDCALLFDGFSL